MADWALDDPNHFTIERLGSQAASPARTFDEQAQLTADFMAHYANFTRRMSRGTYRMPANHFALAWSAEHTGALRNQVVCRRTFRVGRRRSVRGDRERRGSGVLHRATVEHLGHHHGHRRPNGEPQQSPIRGQSRRYLHLRLERTPTLVSITGSTPAVSTKAYSPCAWQSSPRAVPAKISPRRER